MRGDMSLSMSARFKKLAARPFDEKMRYLRILKFIKVKNL